MFSTFPQTLRPDVDARHFGRCSGLDVGAPRGRENGLNPTVEKKCYNVSFEGKCASSLPVNATDDFARTFTSFVLSTKGFSFPTACSLSSRCFRAIGKMVWLLPLLGNRLHWGIES